MTFKISKPTRDEICSIPIYWLTANDKQYSSYVKDENVTISSFSFENREFRIENSAKSNQIFDYERGGMNIPIATKMRCNKPFRNRKHRRNKRIEIRNLRKYFHTKVSQEILPLKYFYSIDQGNYTLRVIDGRTIYRPHSNVGPVYGASGSAADRALSIYPENLIRIGGRPTGRILELVGPIVGSPDTGQTSPKVQIGDQKSTFGSQADVSSLTYCQSVI